MGPAPISYATARYRGIRGATKPPFDPREPIECAGPHLLAEFAADIVPIHGRVCEIERWQPRCRSCLDEAPPFGLFRCPGCDHEHPVGDAPALDLTFRGQHVCVACATRITVADPRFWLTRASEFTDERCALPMYVDVVAARHCGIKILETWWLDASTGCVILPSTASLVPPRCRVTISLGSLYELAHRRAAEALRRWSRIGWAVTAVFEGYWTLWSLVASEAGDRDVLAANCTERRTL